jgi:hypothetical protein
METIMSKGALRTIGTCAGALALTAAALLPTDSAFAAAADVTVTQPGVPTIAPGATGTIDLTLNNPAGTGNAPVSSAVFTAPANTTITTTGSMVSGGPGSLNRCTLNATSTVLTCLPPPNSTHEAYVAEHHRGPALLYRTDPEVGLAAADFDVVAGWLRALPQGPAS